MCDGKLSSKRDVVILSIKPKRPEYPGQKYVLVPELLQEWDKLDAYYRGQLLKLTKSFTKSKETKSSSKSSRHSSSKHKSSSHSKKNQSVQSVDQFTELFGDENLFSDGADSNNNRRGDGRHISSHKSSKLFPSRSLNSLFDDDGDSCDEGLLPAPPPPQSRSRSISSSRKNSLTNVNGNLVVSIPVLSVQQPRGGDQFKKRLSKYYSDGESDSESGVSEDESDSGEPLEPCRDQKSNFLSVPRDNFKVQYGTKQKWRVALVDKPTGYIVPIRVAPYKPPQAQGLNGVQIQKILYHKSDKIQVSPTTTTARTPDKPPNTTFPSPSLKPKVASESPLNTISPRSSGPSPAPENNNATPKQSASQTPPDFASPKSDQGYKSSSSTSSSKLSPPVSSTQKLKRPVINPESSYISKKPRLGSSSSSSSDHHSDRSPGYPFSSLTTPSSTFTSLSTASSSSSIHSDHHDGDSPHQYRSRHSSTSSSSSSSSRVNNAHDNAKESSPSKQKLSIIPKNPHFVKPPTDNSVFLAPAAVSITDRIIKKASRPQPELLERQRRRRQEQNQRRTYAAEKGVEHEERESIDLSMKSFEMILDIQLLSPLRSP